MKKIFLVALVAVFALAGCRRTDVREFAVEVPGLTAGDVPAVVTELAKYAGVDRASIHFDAAAHRLTLRYDSMQLAKKNIEMSIASLGFVANGVTPESIGAKTKSK